MSEGRGLELDFLQRIINVHWGAKDLVVAFGTNGPPEFFLKFPTNNLPDAPVFGAAKDVPTDTREVELTAVMPINNTVVPIAAFILIDHKSFTRAALLEWVGIVPTLTGLSRYYNPRGTRIEEEDMPEVLPGAKGKVIFRDEEVGTFGGGVIYAQSGGPGGDGRVYKLSSSTSGDDEEIIWTIEGEPSAVNYDVGTTDTEPNPKIIIPGHEAPDEINFYDPDDGTLMLAETVVLPNNIAEVSRKGKCYIRTPQTGSTFQGIKGFTREGALLFEILGENSTTGTQFGAIAAYGEDFIVVTGQFPQVNEFSFITLPPPPSVGHTLTTQKATIPVWIMVYDANTGAQVSKTLWGNDVNTVKTDSIPPPHFGTQSHSSTNRESYASVTLFRTAYLPERPEDETV